MHDKKILLIDDDSHIISTLTELFTQAGASVSTAGTYEAGIAALTEHKPDIAIVDVMLGTKSGLDLVKEARGIPGAQPFFAILTNSIDSDHIVEAMESKVTVFIQKADHDPQEIVDMIGRHYQAAHVA